MEALPLPTSATRPGVASTVAASRRIRYKERERIGEGAYGVVCKARDMERDVDVAMKKIRFDADDEGIPATALREITLLRKVRCKNIVHLDDVVFENNKLYLIFEYLDQDLKAYMDSIGPEGMDFRILKSFARQMLLGLAECHARMILHRDLKPQNLLIDKSGNLKLADFGLARPFKTPILKYTHEVVTLWYRAPEILLGSDHYCTAVDMWAAGCIIAEMSNLEALFPGTAEIDQLYNIFRTLGTPNESNWPEVSRLQDYNPHFPKWPARRLENVVPHLGQEGVELLRGLLTYVPDKRMTAAEAIAHAFFDEANTGPY